MKNDGPISRLRELSWRRKLTETEQAELHAQLGARRLLPADIGLQGNLLPALLSDATPEVVARETRAVLEAMRGRPGHIFNLGHGLPPAAKLENIAALVETVKNFK
jgi:uroporphyrinogen-III decarboxylase